MLHSFFFLVIRVLLTLYALVLAACASPAFVARSGDSFHRELELLVMTGIPSRDVLRIATLNGAIALGMDDELGSIKARKRADLVVLGADPYTDIRNTRAIHFVVRNGSVVAAREKTQ